MTYQLVNELIVTLRIGFIICSNLIIFIFWNIKLKLSKTDIILDNFPTHFHDLLIFFRKPDSYC